MAKRTLQTLAVLIAQDAARLLTQGQAHDRMTACRKAAQNLGVKNPKHWPDEALLENAIREYQHLFSPDSQPSQCRKLQQLALDALKDFSDFRPRLAGEVARGTAGENSRLDILLTAETPERVIMALEDRSIPWRSSEVELRLSKGRRTTRPCLTFQAGSTPVRIIILSPADRNDWPREPGSDKPLYALTQSELQALINAD